MKTSELTGPALDWAVAKIEGYDLTTNWPYRQTPEYSTRWSQGGPIIERERIELLHYGNMGVNGNPWEAQIGQDIHYIDQGPMDAICGPTPLIAAMRAFVASKLGDTVEVPEGLT